MIQPNLLILFSDQQRADTLGCYGQRLEVTPHLDRLAREGVRFANAYTCQPVCGPARACLQTGRWATEVLCHVNDRMLPGDAKTIAHHLGDAGYQTAYVGKWHLASHYEGPESERIDHQTRAVPPGLRGGWRDHWVASDVLEFTSHGYGGHMFGADGRLRAWPDGRFRADCVADELLSWLEHGRDPRRPFAAMISWIEPHHQNDRDCYEGPLGSHERWKDHDVPGDLAAFRGQGDWEANYPDYLGCCHAVDANVGRIRSCLERLGAWEDTLVVYTCDHGNHFRTREGEYKRNCHDSAIHIPMIWRGPGFLGGRTVSGLASLLDLPRTLLAAAGVDIPRSMRGEDLARPGACEGREEVFLQISESFCGRAIRSADWTYCVRAVDASGQQAKSPSDTYREDQVYDNHQDPFQLRNRCGDAGLRGIRAELARRLIRQMVAAGEPPPRIESPDAL
jgi:arylsulfatase A-like enzyme